MKKAVSIIVICGLLLSIGAVSIFAMDSPVQSSTVSYDLYTDTDGTKMLFSLVWTALQPSLTSTTSISNNRGYYYYDQDIIFLIRFTNRTNKDLFCNYNSCTINIPLTLAHNYHEYSVNDNYSGSEYSEFSGNLFSSFRLNSNGNTLTFSWHPDFQYGVGLVVPAKQTLYCYFVYTTHNYMFFEPSTNIPSPVLTDVSYIVNSSNVSIGHPTASEVAPTSSFTITDVGYNTLIQNEKIDALYNQLIGARSTLNSIDSTMSHIDSNVQTIIDNWAAQSNQASNVTSETSDVMTTNDTIHNSEAQWYSDNSAALQSVGLSNYQYSQDVTTGFSNISTLFSNLWNSLGSWNTVYTFSMMIGLVMLILRHAPQRRKRSSGGKSDG